MSYMPPPADFGLHYPSWREGQEDAVSEVLANDKRFTALCLATGAGKTGVYMTLAQMEEGRTAILTMTKPLQKQIGDEFNFTTDIRGKGNYPCIELQPGGEYFDEESVERDRYCDVGPCIYGYKCDYKDSGCGYFDTLKIALDSEILLTNYAYWMSSYYFGEGLGKFSLLILDEAHSSPAALAGFFHTELTGTDIATASSLVKSHPKTLDPLEWRSWAQKIVLPKHGTRQMETLRSKIRRLRIMDDTWIGDDGDNMCFDPRTPSKLAHHLFAGVEKVVFLSATVRPKTCELLGIDSSDLHFYEAGSNFPVENRRVTHIQSKPTLRLTWRSTPDDLRRWVNKNDQVIDRRLDRKCILHTGSYKRAHFFRENSRHRDRLITHGSSSTQAAIDRYKAASPPATLVSPAATTGFNFPYDECRCNIIGKIPFPDTTSKIMEIRCKDDPDLSMYIAMQDLVQTCGRGDRAPDDWCENLITDDSAAWFLSKYKHFAPSWFLEGARTVRLIPEPPELA